MLSLVRLPLALLLLLAGAFAATAAPLPPYSGSVTARAASYVVSGQTIQLSRANNEAAIRFKTDLTDEQIVQTVRDACADPAVSLISRAAAASAHLAVLHVTDSHQVETTMKAVANVDFVTPVYLGEQHGRIIPTGDIIIGVPSDAITDEFRAALRERGLEFIESYPPFSFCRAHPIALPRVDVFALARLAAGIPGVQSAEPDFLEEFFIEPPSQLTLRDISATEGEPVLTTDPTSLANVAPPTLALDGRRKLTTTRPTIELTGTVTGEVTSVTYRLGSKGAFKTATGTAVWKLTAKLKPGKNILTVIAHGYGGDSAPVKVTITRSESL